MKVFSFIRQGFELVPVEVEVSFLAGLPKFQIMGLPDTAIKESHIRIKSALKNQGFSLPTNKQILINLRPSYLKKTSRGLDLAIACAFLWKSNQVAIPECLNAPYFIYGELDLEGGVEVPDDLDSLIHHNSKVPILSGHPSEGHSYNIFGIKELKELENPQFFLAEDGNFKFERPAVKEFYFSKEAAFLMSVAALGEHSLLLAGPSGSGKTTLCESIYQILPDPSPKDFIVTRQISKLLGRPEEWRPYVNPHHTMTPLSMIGGGSPLFPGEITRAHGGVLVLDEFLEFNSHVKEALREPMEKGEITISRKGKTQKYPANFHLLATTNLCPCGDFVPNRPVQCSRSLQRCKSYMERLSGPILDRFEILGFSDKWKTNKEVLTSEILECVKQARQFSIETRGQEIPNSKLSDKSIEKHIDKFTLENLMPDQSGSRRRRSALLKVARSIADLEKSRDITFKHIEKSRLLSIEPFLSMKSIWS